MAHVRKVTHRPRKGGGKAATSWQARWTDPATGKPRAKNFTLKGDAEAHLKTVGHIGGSATMTVKDMAEAHYRYFDQLVKSGDREQATLDGFKTAIDLHLASDPAFAKTRLCDLTTPRVQQYLNDLFVRTGSLGLARRHRKVLVAWCGHGQLNGWLAVNVAQPCKVRKAERPEEGEERVPIPTKAELAAVLRAADSGPHAARDTAMVRLFLFGGLRASELLGMADEAVVAKRKDAADLQVRERLERRYGTLGKVKSSAGRRDVPIGPQTVLAVRAWRLQRGPARAFVRIGRDGRQEMTPGRLFPDPGGGPLWSYQAMLRSMWRPLMRRAGLLRMVPDRNGKKRPVAAFTPHALRHAYASIQIENDVKPKRLQELMGHTTIVLTMDLYGHLWRDADEDEAMVAAAERTITQNSA